MEEKMRTFFTIILVGAILLIAPGLPAQKAKAKKKISASLVIINGTIIDGTGAKPLTGGIIAIEGNKIVAVGKAGDFIIPAGAKIIDAKGGTVLPGFIDSHIHEGYYPKIRRMFLEAGITSICDLGSGVSKMEVFKENSFGNEPAARGFRAGPIITTVDGLPANIPNFRPDWRYDACREAATVDDAIAMVKDVLNRNADVIKIYLEKHIVGYPLWKTLSLDQVQAIAKETHAKGKLLRAHLTDIEMLNIALDGGADIFEHIPLPKIEKAGQDSLNKCSNPLEVMVNKYKPFYDKWLLEIVKKGIAMIPTFEMGWVGIYSNNQNKTPFEKAYISFALGVVNQFKKLGGVIGFGTDFNTNNDGRYPKETMLKEFGYLTQAGLSPLEIIKAASLTAAQVSGHGKELGSIEPGKLADIVVVKGNLLADIQTIKNIAYVIKDGEVAFREEKIDRLIKKYREIRESNPKDVLISEGQLNTLGYELLSEDKIKEAIALFKLNVEFYPQSANTYDSYAEALLKDGQKEESIKNYEKSVELNPKNTNAIELLKKLKNE
jgi:imidazolonepropionase-like amidohydrolase